MHIAVFGLSYRYNEFTYVIKIVRIYVKDNTVMIQQPILHLKNKINTNNLKYVLNSNNSL